MASSESNTFEEQTTTSNRTAMPNASTPTQIQNEIANETVTETEIENGGSTAATQRSASYRGIRLSQSETMDEEQQQAEDSWWLDVENNDLLLDQVPNVTSVFTPTPEAILEKSISIAESESVLKDENFDRLHKIADKIKLTLSEHAKNKEIEDRAERERKLSESSDKESKTAYSETDCHALAGAHKEQSLEEFKEELRSKRLQRQNAVQDLRDEIATLRRQLAMEREITKRLRHGEHVEESLFNSSTTSEDASLVGTMEVAGALAKHSDFDDEDPLSRSRHANIELANAQLALQMANSENISLRGELAVVQKQVVTLKEVIACCKQMLAVKEEQCNELKQRLTEIEKSFAEHEMKIMSDNLRQEYERQLVNIRQLRQLYEERQRVAAAEYENLQRLISIKRDELAQEQEKSKSLEERNQNLMHEIETANNELACLRDECREHKFEKAALKEEIGAVNTLFSQMVMGFNGKNNLDIDRLTTMLEENRTLLNDMATKECTDGATLPKLLFELVEQATTTTTTQESDSKSTTPQSQHSRSTTPCKEADTKLLLDKLRGVGDELEMEVEMEDHIVTKNDNENMASLTANVKQSQEDEMPSETSTSCAATSHAPHTRTHSQSHAVDDAVGVCDGDVDVAANNTDGKVIVAAQNKIRKHHRKTTTNNKKSSSMSAAHSSNVAAAAAMKLHDTEVIGRVTSAQEIVGNLPKVWRVLMELLSHHKIDPVQFEENGKGEDCYKSVETPTGPKAELSVSKTYIKLKDLILEKKSLVKETNRLKTLNCHLDYRLNEQEKRLSAVSLELTKTWHLVGKMQRQHRQLHTQEQILRYQLQQKRRLLSELKDELEYCRRKWAAARAKNDESQEQCNDLRREFARRKLEDANNSAESGYSDSGGPASDEEVMVAENVIIGAEGGEENVQNANVDKEDEEEEDNLKDVAMANKTAAGGCVNYRRKRLREMFEHTRKIKRMQSTSPGRADNVPQTEMVVLRWNSAPPTCGWRYLEGLYNNKIDEIDGIANRAKLSSSNSPTSSRGAIPKTRASRHAKLRNAEANENKDIEINKSNNEVAPTDERACRIQRLEEQCKTLIKQVLETSDNRERLEVQLKRFQDEMSPVQYAVPLDEFINKKRSERMTRASSVPLTGSGCLTPREEEYTRKRSERLERLEEESRQLLSRIKRTSDRGHYLRCSLDRIRRAPASREGSFESNTEDESRKPVEEEEDENFSSCETNITQDNLQTENTGSPSAKINSNPLTAEEEAYTARRAARLQRLEEESKQLLTKLAKNSQKGDCLGNKLDAVHERYKTQEDASTSGTNDTLETTPTLSAIPGKMSVEERIENMEKISTNREERLRILEEEGRQLINKLSETSERGTQMINRIAERELNRQKRSTTTPVKDISNDTKVVEETPPVAAALLPTLKTVASSSIVSEELTERVTITTTPSQIAAHQGAIPKSKPTLQLLASRPKSARLQKTENKNIENVNESLEDMIRRLQALPFPAKDISPPKQEESKEKDVDIKSITETVIENKSERDDETKPHDFETSPTSSEQTKDNLTATISEGDSGVIESQEDINSADHAAKQA